MPRSPGAEPASTPSPALAPNLDESLGFLLAETARVSRRLLYAKLASRGIRGGSWHVLRVLWEGDGITQRELAERLGMTQPSTLEMLRAMERDGHVIFRRDTQDRRKTRVFLTDEAQALKAPLLAIADEAMECVWKQITEAEEVLLKRLLRVVRNASAEELARSNTAATTELDLKQEVLAARSSIRKPTVRHGAASRSKPQAQ